jgi:hypothetical protein
MIYLIITTSIITKYNDNDSEQRINQYKHSIENILTHLPKSIKPIIVENNGIRKTFLDDFMIDVHYTDNNNLCYQKGNAELEDIKSVINQYSIGDEDFIIKITGRYYPLNDYFFQYVIEHIHNYDLFLKYFNVCTQQFLENDCVLGLYAIKCKYLKSFNYINITYPEVEFAIYCNNNILNICKMENLNLLCQFAGDLSILIV